MYRGHLEEGNVQGWMFKGIRVDSALATQLHTKEPRRTAKIHKGVEPSQPHRSTIAEP
ncbi:unnamed protein product [Penicillium camemberti]|uniref:Str. FM013 n=1 Tax=Penicillium camemberti (strain FM 013) TaxID=1429867 RepID=A0A0G4P7M2_PENC3|nr:unnamed protein product [Penicillium camemberti]